MTGATVLSKVSMHLCCTISRFSEAATEGKRIAASRGSVSLYVNSSCTQEHALTQQIKFCSSIHLSLDAFQLIQLAIGLSVAILRSLCRLYSIKVPVDSRRQTLQFFDATGFGFL